MYLYFIELSVALIGCLIHQDQPSTSDAIYAMSNTYVSIITGTSESRYRDFDIILQHQQQAFLSFIFIL